MPTIASGSWPTTACGTTTSAAAGGCPRRRASRCPASAAGLGYSNTLTRPQLLSVVIDDTFDDAALRRMHDQGVRGVRFNMVSGNGTPEDQLDALARRLAPLGWHIQFYVEGDKLA